MNIETFTTSSLDNSLRKKMFKLYIRNRDGQLKEEIDKNKIIELSGKYGDIMNCISENKFVKLEEIIDLVWATEKKNPRLQKFKRTRKQIEEAIQELVQNNYVIVR